MLSLVLLCLFLLSICSPTYSEKQWLYQSEHKWDKEWKSGAWEYMDKIAIERSRIAIIGGVFIPMYAPKNASILDVGCGEGAISDFILPGQKEHYVGIDISKEAIYQARKLRQPPLQFIHATTHEYHPDQKFDVIVFSEVLYYVEHEKVLKQYEAYLTPNGIVIISIFLQHGKQLYDHIFQSAKSIFTYVDDIQINGYTKKNVAQGDIFQNREQTASRIEVYRLKSSPHPH